MFLCSVEAVGWVKCLFVRLACLQVYLQSDLRYEDFPDEDIEVTATFDRVVLCGETHQFPQRDVYVVRMYIVAPTDVHITG